MSEKTTLRLAQKFAPGITQHGFRASFSTWAQEQDEGRTYTPTVIEAALAHAKGGGDATSAAYLRSDHFAARRKMMTAWAEFRAR